MRWISFVHQGTQKSVSFVGLLGIIFFAVVAKADSVLGEIIVTVRDPWGVSCKATVKIWEEASGARVTRATDTEGRLAVGSLRPGAYLITVGAIDSAFLPHNEHLNVQRGEQVKLDVALQLPSGTSDPLMTTSSTPLSHLFADYQGEHPFPRVKRTVRSYDSLVDANRRFAFKCFRQMARSAPGSNILIAPVSLSFDFALLQNGADDDATQQIRRTFELNTISREQINRQSLDLRQELRYGRLSSSGTPKDPHDGKSSERLVLSTSLWTLPPTSFRPDFLNLNNQFYSAMATELPTNRTLAVASVNHWAAQQTGRRRPPLAVSSVQSGDFFLLSTTWFRGIWAAPFSAANTRPGDFTLLSGQKKTIPMMSQEHTFFYLRASKFQAVALDYQHATMYLFLPEKDSNIESFVALLTPENWALWMEQMDYEQGYIELPRFKSETTSDATRTLQALGLELPFTSFGSFAPAILNSEGAKLKGVLQTVRLDVSEKGTEVDSRDLIQGVLGGTSSGSIASPFRMLLDRPFVFAICDKQTGTVLYMGTIVDPSVGS